ncbi:YSIRK-type signal peptide-containing protein [Streptococcus suis]|nr:YSIRK-type signal peptide-containing protein [Streptococcus suis]
MSYKDMFRKEQRFSFRKFSFGLASAVIANVILGGAIANSPVVHANTVTEAEAAVAPANQDLGNETKTEEEPKEPIEAVRTDMENRAAEILPEALNASVTNQAPVIPTIGRNAGLSAKNNDARQYEVLHVFGNVSGTTEAESTTGSATAPDFVPENANKAFLATDPEGEDVTIIYGVPGNITAYEAGNPGSLTTNGGDRLSAETKSLGNESNTELVLDDQGRLTGKFPYAPGGLYSRIIKMTDTAGNVSYSNPFYVVAYTDKRADNADLIVGQESDLTATNIFSKLKIDTTSGYSTTNQSLTVPETEYTRTIVGYRLTGTNDVQNLSADTLNTLPAGGNYEIKVKTTNTVRQSITGYQ